MGNKHSDSQEKRKPKQQQQNNVKQIEKRLDQKDKKTQTMHIVHDKDLLISGFIRQSKNIPIEVIKIIKRFYSILGDYSLIIENGSGYIKAGFAGDDAPRVVFPCIVGTLKTDQNTVYVGHEAMKHKDKLNITYPIQHGLITNWEHMENIWHHIFYKELKIDPSNANVLLTEPPLNPKVNREKMVQIMFERFNVSSVYISCDAVLALYAAERTTGVVLDCGYGVCHAVPIYEGYYLPHAVLKYNVGGNDIDLYLQKILTERGCVNLDKQIICDIKEKLGYVALDFEDELHSGSKSSEIEHITIGNERFRCTEILLEPGFIGWEHEGIHKLLFQSITKCDIDIRTDLYYNIVLCGGSSLFQGFRERIQKEVRALAPECYRHAIARIHPRKYSSWIGGSVLVSLANFEEMWVTKQDYDSSGPSIVHTKCA